MARTLYQKILEKHVVRTIDENTVLLYVDLHFANEYTSPQAFAGLAERGATAFAPDAHLCVVDHIIPSADVSPRVIADAASLQAGANPRGQLPAQRHRGFLRSRRCSSGH